MSMRRFRFSAHHDRFITTATSVVEVDAPAAPSVSMAWEEVRDRVAAHADIETLASYEFVFESPCTWTHRASWQSSRARRSAPDALSWKPPENFRTASTKSSPVFAEIDLDRHAPGKKYFGAGAACVRISRT